MKKAFVLAGMVVVALFGGLYGWHIWREHRLHERMARAANPMVTVSAVHAVSRKVAPDLTAVGKIVPWQGAILSPQVGGVVQDVRFHSGQVTRAHQMLLSLDPGPLPGELQAALAKASLAHIDYERARKVYAIHGLSQAALDQARFDAQAASAKVEALRESLADTCIRAPFAGILSLRTVDAGEYIHAGQPVAHIENLARLYVDFRVPQREARVVKIAAPVTLFIHEGAVVRHYVARVSAVSSHVNAESRALAVRARITAPAGLKPGMFVRVTIQEHAPIARLMIPAVAVTFDSYGDFVYVLVAGPHHGLIAREQVITTGTEYGRDIVVRSGLPSHALVVNAGQVKLHSGDRVRINDAVRL